MDPRNIKPPVLKEVPPVCGHKPKISVNAEPHMPSDEILKGKSGIVVMIYQLIAELQGTEGVGREELDGLVEAIESRIERVLIDRHNMGEEKEYYRAKAVGFEILFEALGVMLRIVGDGFRGSVPTMTEIMGIMTPETFAKSPVEPTQYTPGNDDRSQVE